MPEQNNTQNEENQPLPLKIDVSIGFIKEPKNNHLAMANIVLNDSFKVDGLKVMDGPYGLFVNMPSVERNGEYVNTVKPITKDFHDQLQKAVIAKYSAKVKARDKEKPSVVNDVKNKAEAIKKQEKTGGKTDKKREEVI